MGKVISSNRPKLDSPVHHYEYLDLHCPAFGCADGYGHSAERLAMGIEALGTQVRLVGMTRTTGQVIASSIIDPKRRFNPYAEVILFYNLPDAWLPQSDRRTLGFTMYESDALPQAWKFKMDMMDEVLVPSKWLVPIFQAATTTPVKLVPLGVDCEQFTPKLRVRGSRLNFLHFCSTGGEFRKGADLAIRSFEAAFGNRTDVSLTLHSTLPLTAQPRVDSRINFSGGLLSPAQLVQAYHSYDALLYPSRGEGFGMIPLEAMATGMPAIFGNATGMADYAEFGLTVPTHYTDGRAMGHKRPQLAASDGTFGRFQEPNLDALVETLRSLDANYDMIAQQSFENTKKIATQWNWERAANALYRRLGS
jgi:glycosyltransferase involved in cell wall biosynthesis